MPRTTTGSLMRQNAEPQQTTTMMALTTKAAKADVNKLPSASRNPFWYSDPERLSKVIDMRDHLSEYCRFYEMSVEECSKVNQTIIYDPTFNGWQRYFFDQTSQPLLMGLLFTIITIISLAATISFAFLLLKRRQDFQYPIYIIIMNLSISYSLISISQCFVNIPLYLFGNRGKADGSQTVILKITYFVDQFADFSAVLFYVILAVNRLAILSCDSLKVLFQSKTKIVTIGVGWLLAFMASLFTLFFGCRKAWDNNRVLYYDDCPPPSMTVLTIFKALFIVYYALPVISFGIYIYIGMWIAFTRRSTLSESRRVELDLLMQSAITLLFYMAILVLYFLQIDFGDQLRFVYMYDMFINALEVLTGIIFVSVFAIGNKTVRKAAKQMCFPKNGPVAPVKGPLVVHNGTHTSTTCFAS